MRFIPTPLSGAYLIELEKKLDDRGFFARFYCANEYNNLNLDTNIVQINNSYSSYKATLRGIHYQLSPNAETKIIRCIKGSLYDVVVDLRKESPTFLKWYGAELNEDNRYMLYVPKGFGHAFITLADNTEALYLVTEFYNSERERGIKWDDPLINIKWPINPAVISEKDQKHPYFNEEYHLR